MSRVEEASEILSGLGLPSLYCNDRCALTLLALAQVRPTENWDSASFTSRLTTREIMDFMRDSYGKVYAPNSRETIRRQTLHQFVQAGVVKRNPDDPLRPTNSGKTCYQLAEDAHAVIVTFGGSRFDTASAEFRVRGALDARHERARTHITVPIRLADGRSVELSAGNHNVLQKQIVEEFAPRFTPGATLLYLGDSAQKELILDRGALASLGLELERHGKLPDVVLHFVDRNWLVLVEAVTTHGPMSPTRIIDLRMMFERCPAGLVFVSAFSDLNTWRKYLPEIAWDTEVWIAEHPTHLIHFNGDRFLGPR